MVRAGGYRPLFGKGKAAARPLNPPNGLICEFTDTKQDPTLPAAC